MIYLKTDEEVEILRESCLIVSRTLAEIAKIIRPGITTAYLDKIAEAFMRDNGAIPTCKGFEGYPATLCTSVNDQVVHGIPSDKVTLHEGDIITVDTCATKNGFVGDSAYTFCVGAVSPEVQRLLRVTKEALYKGIEQAVEGNRVGDISYAVQSYCEANGYGVVREMVGHGIGRSMHETPEVPNYGSRGKGPLLRSGVTICIEPMITMGSKDLVFESDGWTTRTRDGKYAAHYEHAVAVRRGKAEILSDFDLIEKELKY